MLRPYTLTPHPRPPLPWPGGRGEGAKKGCWGGRRSRPPQQPTLYPFSPAGREGGRGMRGAKNSSHALTGKEHFQGQIVCAGSSTNGKCKIQVNEALRAAAGHAGANPCEF
jgi:anti-sigma regulatory factor (Ser/Thr protein kinase)